MVEISAIADKSKPIIVTGTRARGKALGTVADALPLKNLITDRLMSPPGYSFVIVFIVVVGGIIIAGTRSEIKDGIEVLKTLVLPIVTLFLGFLIGQGAKWR